MEPLKWKLPSLDRHLKFLRLQHHLQGAFAEPPSGMLRFAFGSLDGREVLQRELATGWRRWVKSGRFMGFASLIHLVDGAGAADLDTALTGFDLLWLRRRSIDNRRQTM